MCVTDYGYRYYHPELGRWLSRDPIGERGGLNFYAFVENYAVNQFDVLGLMEYDSDPYGNKCCVCVSASNILKVLGKESPGVAVLSTLVSKDGNIDINKVRNQGITLRELEISKVLDKLGLDCKFEAVPFADLFEPKKTSAPFIAEVNSPVFQSVNGKLTNGVIAHAVVITKISQSGFSKIDNGRSENCYYNIQRDIIFSLKQVLDKKVNGRIVVQETSLLPLAVRKVFILKCQCKK